MHGSLKVIVANPFFPRAVQIADAPIELLQSILRCASIALHLVFELTDPSPPLRILCALLRILCALLLSSVFQRLPQVITTCFARRSSTS